MTPFACTFLRSFALLLAVAVPAVALAQQGDLLEQTRRLNEIKAQKLEADVRDALKVADLLGAKDPAAAVKSLKRVMGDLQDDTALTPARRTSLTGAVQAQIKKLSVETDRPETTRPEKSGTTGGRSDDDEAIQRSVAAIRALRASGKTVEADRLAEDLARRFPNDPFAQAGGRIGSTKDKIDENRRLGDDREKRIAAIGREDEKTKLLPKGDMDFPTNWREKMEKRPLVKMTDKEKAILKALSTPIDVDYSKTRLEDVIDELTKRYKLPLLLDAGTLEKVTASYDTPVTFKAKGVTLRTVLKRVLGDLGLAYVIKEELVTIMTQAEAKDQLVVRGYPVGDLVTLVDPRLGPVLAQAQIAANINGLINMIQATIEPSSWDVRGGPGTITYDPRSMSLIIKQTAEMQFVLGGAFK